MQEHNNGSVKTQSVRAVYDESKRMMEAILYQLQLDRQMVRMQAHRLFNTYGPGMPDDGRVVNTFVKNALEGVPMQVHGGGLQTRSFCYVDDTVRMMSQLADTDWSGVVNVGNPEEVMIRDLADLVAEHTGAGMHFADAREDDPTWRRPEIHRLEELIGRQKFTSLVEGVQKCLS